jgi:hypothetical protein
MIDTADGKKILQMRLEMKPGTKVEHLRITLQGHDLRVQVNDPARNNTSGYSSKIMSNVSFLFILVYVFVCLLTR